MGLGETVVHEWIPAQTESSSRRTGALGQPRSRSHLADYVLRRVSALVARLAIDPIVDRELLFEQYDFKLRSQGDRLGVFCLSIAPAVVGMAIAGGAFEVLDKLRPRG